MSRIDGYWIKTGSMTPMAGVAKIGSTAMELVADTPLLGMVRYQGKPYMLANVRGIYSWLLNDSDVTITSLAEHDGKLYAGTDEGPLLVWDESWWKTVDDFEVSITALCSFDGNLYCGTSDAVLGGRVIVYDGTHNVVSYDYDSTRAAINCLCEFDGNLYAGTDHGALSFVDGTWAVADTWEGTAASYTAMSPSVDGNTLYVGTAVATKLVSFNGSSWTHTSGIAVDEPISSLCVSGGFLYAGTATNADIWKLSGIAWSSVMQGQAADGACLLADYNGSLYYGSPSGAFGILGQTAVTSNNAAVTAIAVCGDTLYFGCGSAINAVGSTMLGWFECESGEYSTNELRNVRALADPTAKAVQLSDKVVVPTKAGPMLVDMGQLVAPQWTEDTYYAVGDVVRGSTDNGRGVYVCTEAHLSANPSTDGKFWAFAGVTDTWPSLGIPTPGSELEITTTISDPGGTVAHSCERTWQFVAATNISHYRVLDPNIEGSYSAYINFNGAAPGLLSVGDRLYTTTDIDLTIDDAGDYKWITCEIYCGQSTGIVSTDDATDSGLHLRFYKTWTAGPPATPDTATLVAWASIPALTYGWNLCVCKLVWWDLTTHDTAPAHRIQAVGIMTSANWAYETAAFSQSICLDGLRFSTDAQVVALVSIADMTKPTLGQSYPMVLREYVACYARQVLGPDLQWTGKWELSNPSAVATTTTGAVDNQSVAVSLVVDAFTDYPELDVEPFNGGVTHIVLFRRKLTGSTYLHEIVGNVEAGVTAAGGSGGSRSITDTGALGTYDEANGLPQFAPTQNLPPPIAKYMAYANGTLWGLCLNYDNGKWLNPCGVGCSTRYAPHAWPDAPQITGEGQQWDKFTLRASEGRGFGVINDQILLGFDSETFVISAADSTSRRPIYLAPIGWASHRSYATNGKIGIWQSADGFYGYNGTDVECVSLNKIDVTNIDLSSPHNAVCDGEHYIFYCTYDDHPSLLILNLQTAGWVIRKLSGMVAGVETDLTLLGIAHDASTNTLYGLTAAGVAVKLFNGDTVWTDGGAGTPVYWMETADIALDTPGRDTTLKEVLLDADAPSAQTLTLTAICKGKNNNTPAAKSVSLTADKSQYETPINQQARVVRLRGVVTANASDAPTINGIGATFPPKGSSR